MGIFSKIKDAIFGHKEAPAVPADTGGAWDGQDSITNDVGLNPTYNAPAEAAAPVDVEATLVSIAANKGNPDLNWRTSIVDLMKLLDMDSSLSNRKELAQELGYTGELDGSADMNIWLHKEVMRQLAANGGHVPASMLD